VQLINFGGYKQFSVPKPPQRQARKRQVVKKPNFIIYLQKNNAKHLNSIKGE
jgi:hypothetical protein